MKTLANAAGEGNAVNMHSPLDKGSATAHGTSLEWPPSVTAGPHTPHTPHPSLSLPGPLPRMTPGAEAVPGGRTGLICPEVNKRVLSRAQCASGWCPDSRASWRQKTGQPRTYRVHSSEKRQDGLPGACARPCWKGWAGPARGRRGRELWL